MTLAFYTDASVFVAWASQHTQLTRAHQKNVFPFSVNCSYKTTNACPRAVAVLHVSQAEALGKMLLCSSEQQALQQQVAHLEGKYMAAKLKEDIIRNALDLARAAGTSAAAEPVAVVGTEPVAGGEAGGGALPSQQLRLQAVVVWACV
jgi:hypothetical protein